MRTSLEQPDEWARLLRVLESRPGRYESITVIDNTGYAGCTAEQIRARIGRDDQGWPDSTVILVADEQSLASTEFPLLAVNNMPDDDDAPFRIALAAAGSFIVNMELGNTSFGDWGPGADADGVYREEHYG